MPTNLNHQGPPFAGFPICDDVAKLKADVAVLGVPYVSPYPGQPRFNCANAPGAIRRESQRYAEVEKYDFDFGGDLYAGRDVRCVDCGDAIRYEEKFADYLETITDVVRTMLERGAVPIVLGGDHGVTIPVRGPMKRTGQSASYKSMPI
jgi:agmatinase